MWQFQLPVSPCHADSSPSFPTRLTIPLSRHFKLWLAASRLKSNVLFPHFIEELASERASERASGRSGVGTGFWIVHEMRVEGKRLLLQSQSGTKVSLPFQTNKSSHSMIDAKLVISITDLIPQSGSLAVVIVSPNFLRHSLSPLSSLFPTLFFSLRLSPIDAARRFFARLIYNVDWPRPYISLSARKTISIHSTWKSKPTSHRTHG